MPAYLISFSEREEDRGLCRKVAAASGFVGHQTDDKKKFMQLLVDYPQCVAFWDAEGPQLFEELAPVLVKSLPPRRLFAMTDDALHKYPHLIRNPIFGHHVWRRYADPAAALYAKLAAACLEQTPFGVKKYFPEKVQTQKIKMLRSGHKNAAVDAIQSFLGKMKINSRLAALVAQAADELVMNAIFDAPVTASGNASRRDTERSSDYELPEKEQVEIEVASCDDYLAFSVTDQFGSLKKSTVMNFLSRDYKDAGYSVWKKDPGAGLGLYGIVHSGLSLLFISKPGVKTEVMIFFARGQSYQQFRAGFRFATIISD